MRDRTTTRGRGLAATAGLLVGYLGVSALLVWGTGGAVDAVRDTGQAPVGSVVGLAAAAGAWAVLSWLTVVTLLALLTAAVAGIGSAAHRQAAALAPAASRRLVGAVLGLTIAGAPVATGLPAGALESPGATVAVAATAPLVAATTPPGPAATATTPAMAAPSLDRPAATAPAGWTPDRPAAAHRRPAASDAAVRLVATTPHVEAAVADEVVVRRGDTLWDIAARHLGPDASAAEVAAEWPRWHHANRHVIGADPDQLRPGERLRPPPG